MTLKQITAISSAFSAAAAALALLILNTGCEKTAEPSYWTTGDGGRPSKGGGSVEQVATGEDAVDFSKLKWKYGGVNGAGHNVVDGQLSNLRVDRMADEMSSNYDPAHYIYGRVYYDRPGTGWSVSGGIFCIFIQRANGDWEGGKMDWASGGGGTKPNYSLNFHNLPNYQGWNETLPLPAGTKIACVIIDGNSKKRTNVAACVAE